MEYAGADPGISMGMQTLKNKSGSAWEPTHNQTPCFCKNKGGITLNVQKIKGGHAGAIPYKSVPVLDMHGKVLHTKNVIILT